ncbi:MAG TPA: hypothetical protein VGB17_04765 [Pyrinomonadaceae bacterium]|jgi:hypothetical protein
MAETTSYRWDELGKGTIVAWVFFFILALVVAYFTATYGREQQDSRAYRYGYPSNNSNRYTYNSNANYSPSPTPRRYGNISNVNTGPRR